MVGRTAELAAVVDWLVAADAAAASPASLALVIEGEAGIGKTTVWSAALERATALGWQTLSCRGAQSEAGLAYVGLADLLRTVPDALFETLPTPQRRPLEVALLRRDAGAEELEPRAVGTGLTGLLHALVADRPVALAVDDAQWLDAASARVLGFALRRLQNRGVRLVAATRSRDPFLLKPARPVWFEGLGRERCTRLTVGPLTVAAVGQVLRDRLGTPLARPTLVRIHQVSAGNPFFALEIARELLVNGQPSPGRPLPVPADHRELALLRLRRLPRETREALLAAAALARPTLREVDADLLAPAERAGLVQVHSSGLIEFGHPLFSSAVYAAATSSELRRVHRELAKRVPTVEERARHEALATVGPNRRTAELLEEAAGATAARGAADAAVELQSLAVQLTPIAHSEELHRRRLTLAQRQFFAGDASAARGTLLGALELEPLGEHRAETLLELGSVIWSQGEYDAGLALMDEALQQSSQPAMLARIHSRAAVCGEDCDVAFEHARAALQLTDEAHDPLLYSFALLNLAYCRLLTGNGADHAAIEHGMRLQRAVPIWECSTVPLAWARAFDQFELARERHERLLRELAEQGDISSSSGILAHLAEVELFTGRIARARQLSAEAVELGEQTGQELYVLLATAVVGQIAAWTGDLAGARAAADSILARLQTRPDRTAESRARAILGHVALVSGDPSEADRQLTAADQLMQQQHVREPALDRFHGDAIEAVIALAELDRAKSMVQRLAARATVAPRPWICAVTARSRALLHSARGELDAALNAFTEALEHHERLDMPFELGRSLLALGRLHRRRKERQPAQRRFVEALSAFEQAGATHWIAVTQDELRRARHPRTGRFDQLTRTEQAVAELAASGLRNGEIAARMYLSPKTVEANLGRVYRKVGVRSRAELVRALSGR